MWKWALLIVLAPCLAHAQDAWEQVRCEAGITSWKREGEPLPTYRARTSYEGSVWDALAVLDDVDRACEWTSHCAEMTRLKTLSVREVLVYARMDAPWPVRDRDVLVHVSVEDGASGELTVHIRATDTPKLAPKHALRMPVFAAHYRFQQRGTKTDVEYQLEFDPGGALPEWLKKLVVKSLAHDTLDDLRERIAWARERHLYDARAEQLAQQSGYASAR